MLHKTIALVCLGVLIGGGCAKKAAPVVYLSSRPADKESTRSYGVSQMALSPIVGATLAASRDLAVRQELVVVAPGAELAKSLEAGVSFCGAVPYGGISSHLPC